MTHEMEINVLMADRCTKAEAERYLKNNTIIYESLEEYEQVQKENGLEIGEVKEVTYEGVKYYVEYVN